MCHSGCGALDDQTRDALVNRIMFGKCAHPSACLLPANQFKMRGVAGGDEVVKAKDGGGSATLSMAYAGASFANSVMLALAGTPQTACTFVESDVTSAPFFASKVTIGPHGIETVHELGALSEYEQGLVNAMLPDLIVRLQHTQLSHLHFCSDSD